MQILRSDYIIICVFNIKLKMGIVYDWLTICILKPFITTSSGF